MLSPPTLQDAQLQSQPGPATRSVEGDVKRLADIRASLQDIQRRKSASTGNPSIRASGRFKSCAGSATSPQQLGENAYPLLHSAPYPLNYSRQLPFAQRDLNSDTKVVQPGRKPSAPVQHKAQAVSGLNAETGTRASPSPSAPAFQVLADTAAADALAAKGASDVDAKQMQAMLRSLMAEAAQSSSSRAATSPSGDAQQAMLRYALARHGEVAIDLQRVGNHCKDIAAELHKVKTDVKDGSFPSTVLQLKQHNAFLADQLQQTAAREKALREETKQHQQQMSSSKEELQQAQEVCREMLAARRSAREALSDMAQQNARLVSAYVEKKQELRHLQDNVREERLQWQMRVEELEAVCHAASFESSLRRAMANTSPICSVSPSTDSNASSQSCLHDHDSAARHHHTTCGFHDSHANGNFRTADDAEAGSESEDDFLDRQDSKSEASSSETELSGLKQQRREWELEKQALLHEMGDLRFRAESQRPPPSGSLSQPSPLNAERSSASLHAESSSTTGFAPSPFQAPYASASPQQHTRPGNDEPAACQHSIFAMQSPVGATGSETHLQTGSPALLDRQEPAQSSAASSDRPGVVQSAAPDTPNTVRLKAKAAQADRLMQENAELRQQQAAAEERGRKADMRQQADQHKQAGNTAFQQQRHQQAADEYSRAIDIRVDDPVFNAVLHGNRAAAQHALGRYVDAIADCFCAASLDPSYIRVLQRRADAYVALGDHSNAAQDLLLLSQKGGGNVSAELMEVQRKAKANGAVHHYKVLGVQSTAAPGDIKSAYRQLALKYHPDKAGTDAQKACASVVFKLISEAYSTLSDADKRQQYDASVLRRKYRTARYTAYSF